jgi:heme-degrading monooxygenase HmoA
MFKIKKLQIRNSAEVQFFHECHQHTEEYKNYFKMHYVNTKKWIESKHLISNDGLTYISIVIWKSQDDFIDLVNDEFIIKNSLSLNNEYNLKNNITTIYESEEI